MMTTENLKLLFYFFTFLIVLINRV